MNNELLDHLDKILDLSITPVKLEAEYRKGDYLIIDGQRFEMSHYSLIAVGEDKQQSRFVEYAGHGLTISLDFLEKTVEIY